MIVVVEKVAAIEIGDIEIHIAVIVIIRGVNALGECLSIHTGSAGNVLKGTVTLVVEELAGTILVADQQVQITVVVDVRPNGSLRACRWFGQASLARNIGECTIAIVSK